jgi:RNA polymerase sigma-70 factor (ECF subfamily)
MNNLPNQEVIDLLNRIRHNDESASRRLYAFYRNQIYRYVRSRIGNRDAIDDIVQETMIAAFKSDKYDGSALYSTWLCAIAMKKISDWGRDSKRFPLAPDGDEEPEDGAWGSVADALAQIESEEFHNALLVCIDKLPVGQRELILLLLDEEPSTQEAAKILHINEGTIKSRGFNARKALHACMSRVFPHLRGGDAHG